MLNYLSTREMAIVIWGVAFLSYMIICSPEVRTTLYRLLKVAFGYNLIAIYIFLTATFAFELNIFFRIFPIWKFVSIKDAVVWFLFAGLPLCFSAQSKLAAEKGYLKNAIMQNVKFIALVEFLINFYTFDLLIELFLQPILVILVIILEFSKHREEYRKARKCAAVLLIIINIISAIYIIQQIVTHYPDDISMVNLFSFVMPICYTVLLVPIAYAFAVFVAYENVFKRLTILSSGDDSTSLKLKKWYIFKYCKLSLDKISNFSKDYLLCYYPGISCEEFKNDMCQLAKNTKNQNTSQKI